MVNFSLACNDEESNAIKIYANNHMEEEPYRLPKEDKDPFVYPGLVNHFYLTQHKNCVKILCSNFIVKVSCSNFNADKFMISHGWEISSLNQG